MAPTGPSPDPPPDPRPAARPPPPPAAEGPDPAGALGVDSGPHAFVDDLDRPALAAEDRHHLARVLRVREGDALTVADGAGRWRACWFGPELEVAGPIVVDPVPAPLVTIAFALVKGERPELIIQKLTELGVDRVVPFVARRSVVRPDADRQARQHGRWARVAREAAMQSRRSRLPEIAPVTSFDEALALPGAVAADRFGGPPSLAHPTVLIGPEGGWADDERSRFTTTVGLGTSVLRAETACFAAAAVLGALRAGLVAPAGSDHPPAAASGPGPAT